MSGSIVKVFPEWGRMEDIQQFVANVPENWLRTFMVRHPMQIRKLGTSRNSTLLFNARAVLAALDAGEGTGTEELMPRRDGIEARQEAV